MNQKLTFIVIGIILLAIIAGGAYWYLQKPQTDTTNTLCYKECLREEGNTENICLNWCAKQSGEKPTETGIDDSGENGGNGDSSSSGSETPLIPPSEISVTPVTPSGSLKILPPTSGIYLGTYDWKEFGQNPGVAEFESAIGKKMAIAHFGYIKDGGAEGTLPSFDTAGHERAYQAGYITAFGIEYQIPSSIRSPQAIINGTLDKEIKQVAQDIKKWGKPIFWLYQREPQVQPGPGGCICPGYDGGGYGPNGDQQRKEVTDLYGQYNSPFGTSCNTQGDKMCLDGPERSRDASRHIHDLVESVAPNQVTWVMGANVGWQKGDYEMFYPGNNYVDWHAFNRYPGAENLSLEPYNSFSNNVLWQEALNLADKPIMILEFGVYKMANGQARDRNKWFNSFFNDVRTNPQMKNLKAFMYWQMGADASDGSNSRIRTTDLAAQVWQVEMQANPNFWLSSVQTGAGAGDSTTAGNQSRTDNDKIIENKDEEPQNESITNTPCYRGCMLEKGNTEKVCIDWCAGQNEEAGKSIGETGEE